MDGWTYLSEVPQEAIKKVTSDWKEGDVWVRKIRDTVVVVIAWKLGAGFH